MNGARVYCHTTTAVHDMSTPPPRRSLFALCCLLRQAVASRVLELKEDEQTFTFEGVASEPTPSLLRDMSAPVKLRYEYSDEDLAFLMKYDTDSFNRWEAGQQVSRSFGFLSS